MPSKRPTIYLVEIVPPEEEPMKRIQRTYTATDLLNLQTVPITLLPSPGPGLRYVIFAIFAHYVFLGTPYILNGNSFLLVGPPPYGTSYLQIVGLLDGIVNKIIDTGPSFEPVNASTGFNQPLRLVLDTGAALTNGNGTLLVAIYYTIEAAT